MTLQELKKNIANVDNSFKIFLCEDNHFLAFQYLRELEKSKSANIEYINAVSDMTSATTSILSTYANIINVIVVAEFSEIVENYSDLSNCIVICDKINKSIESAVSEFVIKFPKLLDWQIKDYIKLNCGSLQDEEVDWLYEVTQGDIYKIDSEISKIKLFTGDAQRAILQELKFDQNTDLFYFDQYFLSNSLVAENIVNIINFIRLDKCQSVKPLTLIGGLISELKRVLFIKFNSGVSADSIKVSQKQYYWIANHYSNLTEHKIYKLLNFLAEIDFKIKSGALDLCDKDLSDYIIINYLLLCKEK